MSTRRRVVATLVPLCLLLSAGCIEPVKLAVIPVTPAVVPTMERPCPTDCLTAGSPDFRVVAPAGEELLWVKASPDGKTLVASIAPTAGKTPREIAAQPISFAAIDTESGEERWRVRLAQTARIAAEDVYFVGNDKVSLLTAGGFLFVNTLMTLDLATGRELWRTPRATGPGKAAHSVLYDPERQFFLVGSTTLQMIDANTGQVIATRSSLHKANNRRVTGGIPWVTGDDLYLYDFGLVRVAREEKKFLWGRRFVTFAKDDYVGANIGLAIAGALLGANTGDIPPDYLVGRSPEPVRTDDRVVTAGVGVVHCLKEADGAPVWSRDLAVPEVTKLVVRGDRVYALAGGNYLFWHGRQGMTIREPLRYGLYALSLADGAPLDAFSSPFNPNDAGRGLTAAEVESYDEGDAFEEEEDWGDLKKTAPGAVAPATAPAPSFSRTRLVSMETLENGLLVAAADAVYILDENGAELARHALAEIGQATAVQSYGDTVIVRARDGVAAFDGRDGTKVWEKRVAGGDALELMGSGAVPLIRTQPWKEFRDLEAKHFGGQLFWVCEKRQIVVLPAAGSRFVALNVRDGSPAWEIPVRSKIALDLREHPAHLVTTNGAEVEVYRIP